MHIKTPLIETDRLILRPFEDNAFSQMRMLDSDPDVMRYLGHGKVRSESETQTNIKKIFGDYERYGLGLYATYIKFTGEFIGRTGLIPWMFEGQLAWEIGYSLLQNHWKKGYATEAAKGARDWALANLDVPYLVSFIHAENTKSIHVSEKLGMKFWKDAAINDHACSVYRLQTKLGQLK